jgi:trans-aconitate 2-methyltransferase
MEARHGWDAAAYHRASDVQEERARRLLELLPLRGDEVVLDAGCGSGRVTEMLVERLPQGRVIGVDSSEEMVEHARSLLGEWATVMQADLTELELDSPVDAVFSNFVFHWIRDQERLFARLHDVLRPGGILVASSGAPGNLGRFFETVATVAAEPPFEPYLADFEAPWQFRTAEETEQLMGGAGFTGIEISVEMKEQFPEDPAGYARTAPLLCHLALLPEELHDRFVEEVISRCDVPMRIDHVHLMIRARRD